MSDHKFDRLLSEIRSEHVDDQVVSQAADRVRSSIAGSPTAHLSIRTLRSCEDFQTLIPAYLDKNLPEARWLLLEDHLHQCVACRRAVQQISNVGLQPVWQPAWNARPAFPVWQWAMGAAAAIFVAVMSLALVNGLFPGQPAIRGAVQNV
ncbi:MAG TPA: zf-HC2 domain-containing protein, partial [Candidatus Acidoferrum sp.]|nr:zf-HC2 domain-containing protein [Candidatus Acidoferrum sp.]